MGLSWGLFRADCFQIWLLELLRDGMADEFEGPELDRGRGRDEVEPD